MLSKTTRRSVKVSYYYLIGLDLYCKKTGIQDGMSVLDLGCGWGSLSLFVVRMITSVSLTDSLLGE